MKKEEFEVLYSKKSGIPLEELKTKYGFEAKPCNCDYPYCQGWQATFKGEIPVPKVPSDWIRER